MSLLNHSQQLVITSMVQDWYYFSREQDIFLHTSSLKVGAEYAQHILFNAFTKGAYVPASIKAITANRDSCLLKGLAFEKICASILSNAKCLIKMGISEDELLSELQSSEQTLYGQLHTVVDLNQNSLSREPLFVILTRMLRSSDIDGIAIRNIGDSHANGLLKLRATPGNASKVSNTPYTEIPTNPETETQRVMQLSTRELYKEIHGEYPSRNQLGFFGRLFNPN